MNVKTKFTGTIHLIASLLVILFFSACGIQMKQASLYDGVDESPAPPPPANIALAVEPEIFNEDGTDFWVTEDSSCTSGFVTREEAYDGEFALHINWNRDPSVCEWAGFGIGWDGWSGKDLSEVYDHAAIEMYVRSQEGKMYGIPMILTLEDYSGHMAWSYASLAYFEKYYIDEEWQRVLVPLNSFDLDEDGLDITNVKQLQFELQQAGGIYLDDIKLIYAEPLEKEIYDPAEQATAMEFSYPVKLFGDAWVDGNGWGLHSDACQTIALTSDNPSEGDKCIHAKWDTNVEDCYLVAIGASWNNWFVTDMTKLVNSAAIELDIRTTASTSELPVMVGFEDYERRTSFVTLDQSLTNGGYGTKWTTVRIPLAALPKTVDFADIKQFMMKMEGKGEVFIDNIRISTFRS